MLLLPPPHFMPLPPSGPPPSAHQVVSAPARCQHPPCRASLHPLHRRQPTTPPTLPPVAFPVVICYKSHNCHIMMMVFLTIAIRVIKPMRMKVLITRLCYFFNIDSQKLIGHKEFDDLKAYMIETMCMLEMCFPPFLYSRQQEHLMIYLVDQILTLGPLYLQSMFPY
jgi:hypothetical protein